MALPAREAAFDGVSDQRTTHERFVDYQRTRSRALRNRLVEDHLHLVDHYVRRFARRGVADDDLRQVCLVAVLHATERYDPSRGVAFPTFASRTIEGEVKRHLRDRTWAVRPPRQLQELFLDVRRCEEELTHQLGRTPTVDEIADRVDEPSDRVLEALEAGGAHRAVALDAPSPGFDDGDAPAMQMGTPEPEYEQVELREVVSDMLDRLPSRDRRIIEMRFFADLSQLAIAERVGVSQSYLSRRLRSILGELRGAVGADV